MAHAFLSASGAPAWLLCNMKPWLEKDLPDSSSAAADEGTAAHELAAWCLLNGRQAKDRLGELIRVGDDFWEVTEDMAGYVQMYLDNVKDIPGDRMIEQPLEIGFITNEEDAKGTGDLVAIHDSVLEIHDLKYGYNYVPADSDQLKMYGAAAVRQFSTIYDIDWVVLQIHQPRINSFPKIEISVQELHAWVTSTQAAATRILAGPEGLVATPGDKQCKFCRAKGACPALKEKAMSVVRLDDFHDLDARIALLSNEELANIAPKLELIHDWCNGVRAEMERRILSGQHVDGWKVVQGKKGNRAWSDTERVEHEIQLLDLEDKAYSRKLLTPTQMEKALGKTDAWTSLKELVTQPDGKPAVVPITDKRPALSLACDFQPIQE